MYLVRVEKGLCRGGATDFPADSLVPVCRGDSLAQLVADLGEGDFGQMLGPADDDDGHVVRITLGTLADVLDLGRRCHLVS